MCPRCKAQARRTEDPEYCWCWYCGPVPLPTLIRLPHINNQPRVGMSKEGIEQVNDSIRTG